MWRVLAAAAWLSIGASCSLVLDGDRFQPPEEAGDAAEPAATDAAPHLADAGALGDARPPDAASEPDAMGACVETCPSRDCQIACPAGECDCTLDCASTDGRCKPRCENDDCVIDCSRVEACEATCRGATTCEISCVDAEHCEKTKCEDGAACLLDCSGARECRFETCDGTVTSCPDNILACNRPCP